MHTYSNVKIIMKIHEDSPDFLGPSNKTRFDNCEQRKSWAKSVDAPPSWKMCGKLIKWGHARSLGF